MRSGVTGDGARLRRLAATASLSVAVALSLVKLVVAILTGSVALLASLVDSLADVVASGITFAAVRIAQQPPDRRHRFGHGKAESLSALAQSALVAGSAVFVLTQAVGSALAPQPLSATGLGIATILIAIVVTLALVAFQRHVVRRTGSQAIAADSLHYRTDLLVNLAVLTALLATNPLGLLWLDPLIGGMIALYLLTAALRIGRRAIGTLMDHELGPAERERIKAIINGHPEVRGLHDLRTREAAGVRFIECHIELDGALTIDAAHVITDTLEGELTAAFPDAEIIIHPEPAGLEDARLDDRIRAGADAAAARRRFG